MRSIIELKDCAADHLRVYTDPAGDFAFATYDRWYSDPNILTALDCLAANLLALRLNHRRVIPLFQQGDSAAARLRLAMQNVLDATPSNGQGFVDLDSIDDSLFRLVRTANMATGPIKGWTAVTVCKVLHRLRPELVPVYDSVVRKFYGTPAKAPSAFFEALHVDLRANRAWLAGIAAAQRTPDNRPLSLLRAADIMIWHHEKHGCSGSVESSPAPDKSA